MTPEPGTAKVAKAIALASAASSALVTLGLAVFNLSSASAYSDDAPLAYLAWFAINFVVTVAVSSTIGLAWHAVCRSMGWTSVHAYWTVGALAGTLPGVVWLLPSGAALIAAFVLCYGALLGGLTGLFAWLIRRPDRDAANPPTSSP